jgi:uncharacterized protein (TIGR04222 family)
LLWLFIAASAAVTAATLVRRRRIFRGAVGSCAQEAWPPAHVGYLAGGPMRALEVSLTLLSRSGAVDIDQDSGKVQRVGALPASRPATPAIDGRGACGGGCGGGSCGGGCGGGCGCGG